MAKGIITEYVWTLMQRIETQEENKKRNLKGDKVSSIVLVHFQPSWV